MAINYDPLWETMKKNKKSTYMLIKKGISKSTIDRLKHNRPISTITINKLCHLIECKPADILEYVED